MKFYLLFFFAFSFLVYANEKELKGLVVSVSDGDTIKILDSKKNQIKIRLISIDAPEMSQAFGKKSKQKLSDLVFKKEVRVLSSGTDQFGRTLGTVYIDELNVNEEMIKTGLAWVYKSFRNRKSLLELESSAKEKRLGLWEEENPTPPWDFRKSKKSGFLK